MLVLFVKTFLLSFIITKSMKFKCVRYHENTGKNNDYLYLSAAEKKSPDRSVRIARNKGDFSTS